MRRITDALSSNSDAWCPLASGKLNGFEGEDAKKGIILMSRLGKTATNGSTALRTSHCAAQAADGAWSWRTYACDDAKRDPAPLTAEMDFRAASCEKFQCSFEDFDRRVFWKCLYRHALPLAAFLLWAKREFFQPDLELIHSLATTTTFSEVRAEACFIRHDQRMQAGFLRGTLRIRISGRRLAVLAGSTLAPEREGSQR